MGSVLVYQYFKNRKNKKNKRTSKTKTTAPVNSTKGHLLPGSSQESSDDETPQRMISRRKEKWTASTPFFNLPETPPDSDEVNNLCHDTNSTMVNSTSSILRSFSLSSMNGSIFGDGTVNKLEMLLGQIEDIKKSVVEMDADLFSVKKVTKNSTKHFLTFTAPDETSVDGLTGPPSPTLEWDSNDIIPSPHHESFLYSKESTEELLQISGFTSDSSSHDSTKSSLATKTLDLHVDCPSPSSGKGSMVSSPGFDRDKHLQEMIEEAQKMGLINELLTALLKVKRDSAYFED